MPTTKEITITVNRKKSDGNYGSFEASFSETLVLEKGDNATTVAQETRDRLIKLSKNAVIRMKNAESKE